MVWFFPMSSEGLPSGSCLARLVWFLFGPMLLLVFAILIAEKGGGWLGPLSLAFLAILAMTVLARWLDFRGGLARTAEGTPATPAHLRRYVMASLLIGFAVWTIANLIGVR